MLDGRVLTAVFASLAAVATAMSGGAIEAQDVRDSTLSAPGENSYNDIVPSSLQDLDMLSDFFENPEPETSVQAELKLTDLEDTSFTVSKSDLEVEALEQIAIDHRNMSSRNGFEFNDFEGEFNFNGNRSVKMSGSSQKIRSNGVNITGITRIDQTVETDRIQLEGIERTGLDINGVTGEFQSQGSTTSLEDPKILYIDSFSGDLTVDLVEEKVILDGRVHMLEAGPVSLGG